MRRAASVFFFWGGVMWMPIGGGNFKYFFGIFNPKIGKGFQFD